MGAVPLVSPRTYHKPIHPALRTARSLTKFGCRESAQAALSPPISPHRPSQHSPSTARPARKPPCSSADQGQPFVGVVPVGEWGGNPGQNVRGVWGVRECVRARRVVDRRRGAQVGLGSWACVGGGGRAGRQLRGSHSHSAHMLEVGCVCCEQPTASRPHHRAPEELRACDAREAGSLPGRRPPHPGRFPWLSPPLIHTTPHLQCRWGCAWGPRAAAV